MILIEDIIDEISMGPFGSDIKVDNFVSEGVPVLNGSNINSVRLSENFSNFVTKEKAKSLKKANAKRGDIIVTHRGTLGQIAYIPENSAMEQYVISQSQFRVSLNRKLVDPAYFTYYFHTQEGQKRLLSFKSHVGVPALAQATSNFRKLEFPLIPLSEQLKVAKILSDLDSKIELNNKINAELEGIAKLIYDYWFVQFDFPDSNGKPYKSSGGKMVFNEVLRREVPEGWSVKEIGELVKFERGLSYKSKDIVDDGIPMINLNSFDLTGKYKEKGLKYFSGSYNEKKVVSPGDLVIAVTDVTRNADIIGKAFTIPYLFNKDVLISCDVAKIIPSGLIDEQFLEMLFNSDNYHNYIKHFASGTLVLHLNLDGVKCCKIPLPPKSLLDKYREIRKNINSKITIAIKENLELERLRDWLIPMLMNGQIIVK